MKCWARTHLLLPNLFFETLTLTYRECLSHPPLLIVSFFFHAVGKNSALSFPPPITIYNTSLSSSLHIARMLYLNVMRSPIELAYYYNYSTRLHSTYIKRWGFYGLIIGDQRAQTCCISINFLRKFWSGSVEESLSGPPHTIVKMSGTPEENKRPVFFPPSSHHAPNELIQPQLLW